AVALLAAHAFLVARRVSRPLARDPALRDQLLPRYERWRFVHQVAVCASYVLILALLGWGWAVRKVWTSSDEQGWFGTELLTLLPFFAAQVLTWLFFYDADRAAHRAAHRLLDDPFAPAWLETQAPADQPGEPPAFGSRWTYVAFQARQKLALVLLPVLLLI